MLAALGYASLDELTSAALPAGLAMAKPLRLPDPLPEDQALARLRALAAKNQVLTSMIGLGYYGTITPPVIRRNVLESPAWYTAYTPYQPEISQGRLEALLNFQTMIEDLTCLPVAGASMLDEATAAAEAMTLARRAATGAGSSSPTRTARRRPSGGARHPGRALGFELVTGTVTTELIEAQPEGELFGILLQYPVPAGRCVTCGQRSPPRAPAARWPPSPPTRWRCPLLTPPGELGADIAVGSTQRFGVPMGYGGPQAGYICVRDELKRQLPGPSGRRLRGRRRHPGLPARAADPRAAHQADKATSNICTAQVLLAVIAAMYATYHGAEGLTSSRGGSTGRRRVSPPPWRPQDLQRTTRRISTPWAYSFLAAQPRPSSGPVRPDSISAWPDLTWSRSPATRRRLTSRSRRWPARSPGRPRRPRRPPRTWRRSRPGCAGRAASSPIRCSPPTAARPP
jgi:glycine dehydrogenase